jgi:hypothetical protein
MHSCFCYDYFATHLELNFRFSNILLTSTTAYDPLNFGDLQLDGLCRLGDVSSTFYEKDMKGYETFEDLLTSALNSSRGKPSTALMLS